MSIFALDHEMRAGLKQWDGVTWFVEEPVDFVRGLYSFSQLQARDILKRGKGLTNWEAEVCQRAFYSHKPPSAVVDHWLSQIEAEKCGEVLA